MKKRRSFRLVTPACPACGEPGRAVCTPGNVLSLLIAYVQSVVVGARFDATIEWRCRACNTRFLADPDRID